MTLVLRRLILMEREEITRTLHEKILRPAVKDDIMIIKKKERGRTEMEILSKKISRDELNKMDSGYFEDMIKAVVDIEKQIIGVDAELHADIEGALIDEGSEQRNLWGINFLTDEDDIEEFVEFDSLINIRPKQNNRSRDVEDENIRNKILEVVEKWIEI